MNPRPLSYSNGGFCSFLFAFRLFCEIESLYFAAGDAFVGFGPSVNVGFRPTSRDISRDKGAGMSFRGNHDLRLGRKRWDRIQPAAQRTKHRRCVLVTERLEPRCLLAGIITEFSAGITPGSRPTGITAGPDGNLWFTEPGIGATGSGPDRIGRITPAGTVTEFSAGITPGSVPEGITAGPDGNLWFAEYLGSQIGRITPAGTVTEFSAGITPGSGPLEITAGPDGNLWFTETGGGADRIGRITPAGTVTEFSAGITPGSQPEVSRPGPTAISGSPRIQGDRIGRITPAGTVTEFSTGITPSSGPNDITAGPDGNLWFTEIIGGRIGRITPAGTVTEFSAGITPRQRPAISRPGPMAISGSPRS